MKEYIFKKEHEINVQGACPVRSRLPRATVSSNGGFVALVSTLILTVVLSLVMFSNSTSSFFARLDALGSEFKRVSLGLSESCVNQALLKIAQDYHYNPGSDGETIEIEEDKYECVIDSVEYTPVAGETSMDKKKLAKIKTKAEFPIGNGSWSTNQIVATVQNPEFSVTIHAPTCSFGDLPEEISQGQKLTLTWLGQGQADEFYIRRITDSDPDSSPPYWFETTTQFSSLPPPDDLTDSPTEGVTYRAFISGPGGTTECLGSPQSVSVQPPPLCADVVMMLDRTGSMAGDELQDEENAAKGLLDLYASLDPLPLPKVSVGVFGAVGSSSPYNAEIIESLTDIYAGLYDAIENGLALASGGTNLSSAINVSQNEFEENGSVDEDDEPLERALILVSDGITNSPSSNPDCTPGSGTCAEILALKAAENAKNAGTQIFSIHFGDAVGRDFLAELATDSENEHIISSGSIGPKAPTSNLNDAPCSSNPCWSNATNAYANGGGSASDNQGDRHRYYNFGFTGADFPTDTTITGIEVLADAWSTGITVLNTGFKTPTFASTNNNYNDWNINTVTNIQTSNDVLVSDNNENDNQGYEDFSFSIPSGSVINGIEASIEAKSLPDTSGCRAEVALSWNNGGNFTSEKFTPSLTGIDAVYPLGSVSDTWGHSWTPSQLNNSNFVARISFDDVSGNQCQNSTVVSVDQLQIKVTYTTSTPSVGDACELGVSLSWNDGNTWTSGSINPTETKVLTGTEATYIFGGQNENWGRTWQINQLTGDNFRVRVHDIDPGVSCADSATTNLDYLRAKVYYKVSDVDAENSDDDHYFIAPEADDMEKLFDTIGRLVCPALSPPDSGDPLDSPPPPPPPPPPIDIDSWDEVIST